METKWFVIIGLVVTGALYGLNQSTHSGDSGVKPAFVDAINGPANSGNERIFGLTIIERSMSNALEGITIQRHATLDACKALQKLGAVLPVTAPVGYRAKSACVTQDTAERIIDLERCGVIGAPNDLETDFYNVLFPRYEYQCKGRAWWNVIGWFELRQIQDLSIPQPSTRKIENQRVAFDVAKTELNIARDAYKQSTADGANHPDIMTLEAMGNIPEQDLAGLRLSVEQYRLLRNVAARISKAHKEYYEEWSAAGRPYSDYDTSQVLATATATASLQGDELANKTLHEIHESWLAGIPFK